METIHEVIEEDLPEWAKKAFMAGTLFADLGKMIDTAYAQGVDDSKARIMTLEGQHAALYQITNQQAEDDGLWFFTEDDPTAYLQRKLRALHHLIEEMHTVNFPSQGEDAQT